MGKKANKAPIKKFKVKEVVPYIKDEKVAVKGSNRFKRLFFDIETSPNIVYSWNIGYDINLDYNNIIKERAIICICYKWEHESKVRSLKWYKGDDKAMLLEFTKIMAEADEVIGHNSDQYDIRWFRTRCLYHGISAFPDYVSVDTLKLSRRGFRFNSNRLDYISRFLGIGHKADTGGFDLWKSVIDGDEASMTKMINYCKKDVLLLEEVFNKLNPYVKHKTHAGLLMGKGVCTCPNCASPKYTISKSRTTASGIKKIQLQCRECNKYYTIPEKQLITTNK